MKRYCKHLFFMEIVFNEFRDRFLSFFGRLGKSFSGFLGFENMFENQRFL